MLGYQNKVLRINCEQKTFETEPLNMEWAKKYIGSKGLSIKYMYEELAPGIDPLGPENKLYFMTGPLNGTTVPCSGKLSVAAKSPATGTMNDCSIGGHVGNKIKYAGYDAVVFEKISENPIYIVIDNEKIAFEDAKDLWGKDAHETEAILSEKYGTLASIMTIGPAGENLLGTACINTDYYRQAGRGGIGSVMGSKKIKAVVVIGTGSLKINDPLNTVPRIAEILKEDCANEDNSFIYTDGTTAFLEACNDGGILPKNNFQDTTDPDWTEYNGEVLLSHKKGKRGCGSCGLGCGNFLEIDDAVCEGPEYETIAVAGPNAGIKDPYHIVKFNQVCDAMGVDTISAGDIICFAMEMTEKGVHDFGIRFGEAEKVIKYIELMAKKEGIGADLALGVKKLVEKYGGEDYALHVKGLEYPQYEPRGSWGMSVCYAVSDRGACHMRAYAPNEEVFEASIEPYISEGKGQMVKDLGTYNAVKFSMCICDFWPLSFDTMAEVMSLVTGEEFTAEKMEEIGVRVLNIGRAFNQREGFTRKDDTIPNRLVKDALSNGPAAGQKIPQEEFDKMLSDYYEVMGWTENGTLPEDTLKTL